MRDDLTFVERVHRDLRDVRWPEPEEIRSRARRRSRRAAALAAAAVLAVTSGSVYVATGRPQQSVPPPAAATPEPGTAEIPQGALLTASDFAAPTGVQLGDSGLGETVRLDPLLKRCGGERGLPPVDPASRYSRSLTFLSPGESSRTPVRAALSQDVYRVDPVVGAQLFGQIKMLLNACGKWQAVAPSMVAGRPAPAESEHHWELAVSGFAGDESAIVRHGTLPPRTSLGGGTSGVTGSIEVTIVVRVGDLVTVLAPAPEVVADKTEGTGPGLSYADLEALGRTAARRLCLAANPRC
jgi:hypothetical protein